MDGALGHNASLGKVYMCAHCVCVCMCVFSGPDAVLRTHWTNSPLDPMVMMGGAWVTMTARKVLLGEAIVLLSETQVGGNHVQCPSVTRGWVTFL